MQLYRITANLNLVPLRGMIVCRFPRGGGVLSFASPKESTQRKGDPGLLENTVPNGPPQAPPNSPLANGAGLRQIGGLRVRIFDSLSTILGQNRLPRLAPTG